MATSSEGFKGLAATKYKGVQIDLLEGHIHEFKGNFIAIPIPANNMIFSKRFSAKRVFEAAGDANGEGALSIEVKKGATAPLEDREGSVNVTRAYELEPGVKKIIHHGTAGLEIPQPDGIKIALKATALVIDNLVKKRLRNPSDKELPAQIGIVLPPPEGEDVREDKRDEAYRRKLVDHFVDELPKHLKYSLAPAGVNAPPESFNAPAGPAVARGPSGGQYRATSSGLPTATRTCCPAAEPAQSPLKPPSEHDSPEENIDQDIGDHNDDEKKIEDVDNNSNQDPGDEEKEEGDEEGYGEEVEDKTYKGVLIELCAGVIYHFPSANPKGPPYARILVTDAVIELDGSGGADDESIHAAASRLLQDQLRETFRPRKLETTVKIEARKKLEAEELQISREELKKNLDNLYRRIGEEKRFEREKKHAERAAAEKAKETRKYMVLVQTGKLRPVQGTSEDVPMTQPTRHIRHEAKEGQRRGKVLFTAMPAKSGPQISRKIPGTRRSPAQKMSARKTVEEAVTEPRPGKEGCFLAPEQIVDSGIGTRLRTGPKRSRSDIEEQQVASKQSKRLKM
ncbi:hypothetical protein IFR04_001358 [Cadophora malorum]|uniref:Uncharacterized protein n=1 Tax=Cadophora malorum TaxID=108018 RepID=A0A8H8BVP7_9HELO|nr:hypothetical protein IFR04_001358 [Cadophora malorum]